MIKMIAGVYGYREGGIIMPKDKNSEPFSLNPEREAELVTRGVAEYANLIIPEEPKPADQNDDSRNDEDGQNNGDGSQDDEGSQNNGDGSQDDEGSQNNGDGSQDDEDGQNNGDGSQDDEDGQNDQKQKPEYSEKMKLPELQALAASYGLDAQKMRAKAEVVKLLDDYFKDDGEQPPTFGAMDPVE